MGGVKRAATTSRGSSGVSSRASSRASSSAVSEEEDGEDGGGDVSKRQAKGEERYVVRVVCVDPKKEFGKMATGQQQLPKKPNISFSVTIKEGPLTEERSRDIVQLVLEKLPGGPLSENDVVKLGCKSLKRGNITHALTHAQRQAVPTVPHLLTVSHVPNGHRGVEA